MSRDYGCMLPAPITVVCVYGLIIICQFSVVILTKFSSRIQFKLIFSIRFLSFCLHDLSENFPRNLVNVLALR